MRSPTRTWRAHRPLRTRCSLTGTFQRNCKRTRLRLPGLRFRRCRFLTGGDEIRKRRIHRLSCSQWRWHLDEVFVRINGETHYLWRAVDHEGEVLEVFVTKRRDRRAALKFLKRTMRRYGRPRSIVTDRLRSYRSAMRVIGNPADQECGRWLNNRAENSHQPFRRRERAMQRFRAVRTLQKFAAAHASIHNHFNHDRHLNRRDVFKQNRSAALAEWRQLAA